jgi:hypothetical protein
VQGLTGDKWMRGAKALQQKQNVIFSVSGSAVLSRSGLLTTG